MHSSIYRINISTAVVLAVSGTIASIHIMRFVVGLRDSEVLDVCGIKHRDTGAIYTEDIMVSSQII